MIATMHVVDSAFEEEELVRRAGMGDRSAFGELYRRYARVMHGILLARVPAAEAEDLVQDVFLCALRQLPLLRTPAAFRGWLAAIARNRAADYHRNSRELAEIEEDDASNPAPQDARHDALAALAAIRRLPPAYRETLILRLVEGLTGPEIADRTGLTRDSVRVNLFRGMKLLREQMTGREAAR
jgi:RNA polymerase sigma-70 factor (ECF subfamily)